MEFRIWVETRLAGGILERELVAQLELPPTGIGPEEIGLSPTDRHSRSPRRGVVSHPSIPNSQLHQAEGASACSAPC
jgi:hypothetical protein